MKENQDTEIKQMEDNINRFPFLLLRLLSHNLSLKIRKIERIEVENEDVSKFIFILYKV